MSGPWNAQQVEWLQALGLEVLQRLPNSSVNRSGPDATNVAAGTEIPAALRRAARGVDLAPLLAQLGAPRDAASRRAFWRALRPLRRAVPGR